MSIDLSGLSAKELASLIRDAQKRKNVVAKRQPISKVRSQLVKAAEKAGYTIEELFGSGAAVKATRAPRATKVPAKSATKGTKVPPKYRDPANAENIWTGRGRQPRWLAEYTAGGRTVEEFLIEK
ncbi:H-NS histone family protein [Stenotrophomonas sp. CPCC 101365]|uniref:H-NS histone family protein n=1 Tax=Stenotrophomonas mori TaxID=2871096 RepID=A0ABT0SJP3_9GAMM|nr:H-NS histone family protein [Stenotrophomonas mori]